MVVSNLLSFSLNSCSPFETSDSKHKFELRQDTSLRCRPAQAAPIPTPTEPMSSKVPTSLQGADAWAYLLRQRLRQDPCHLELHDTIQTGFYMIDQYLADIYSAPSSSATCVIICYLDAKTCLVVPLLTSNNSQRSDRAHEDSRSQQRSWNCKEDASSGARCSGNYASTRERVESWHRPRKQPWH